MPRGTEKSKTVREIPLAKDGKARVSGTAAVRGSSAGAEQPNQLNAFDGAMRLFHARKFAEAKDLFAKAANGPNRAIGHKAALQLRMCDQRLKEPQFEPKSLDDHYNYAVTLINARNLPAAQKHLQAALEIEPQADHVYYALALCRGLGGDLDGAYENLKRAIELQPRNRIAARQDTDFAAISNQPPLDRLLFPEKTPRY